MHPTLSVIIPTKNEQDNIANCCAPFAEALEKGICEVIVVDNFSTDSTLELAASLGVQFYSIGPERSTQRNYGASQAIGQYLLFLDADMILQKETLEELLQRCNSQNPPDAMYIREYRVGKGLKAKARNFERSFYDATCIDGLRLFKRKLFMQIGGYDEALTGTEDWDIDRRVLAVTKNVALSNGLLIHNEKLLSTKKLLEKKAYYASKISDYQKKWGNDKITRKQLGLWYRFVWVFLEKGKWLKVIRHPILFTVMMLERIRIGAVYLKARNSYK
ncbi:MAG: glycosyltransferase [Kiritimatiellae bacterium]|nr:glycosyltransferase [Kiritimatiellia bacterium]